MKTPRFLKQRHPWAYYPKFQDGIRHWLYEHKFRFEWHVQNSGWWIVTPWFSFGQSGLILTNEIGVPLLKDYRKYWRWFFYSKNYWKKVQCKPPQKVMVGGQSRVFTPR